MRKIALQTSAPFDKRKSNISVFNKNNEYIVAKYNRWKSRDEVFDPSSRESRLLNIQDREVVNNKVKQQSSPLLSREPCKSHSQVKCWEFGFPLYWPNRHWWVEKYEIHCLTVRKNTSIRRFSVGAYQYTISRYHSFWRTRWFSPFRHCTNEYIFA